MDFMGRRDLVDYGIQNDQSDYRAHVCFKVKEAYVFPTKSGLLAVQSGRHGTRTAGQPGIPYKTAAGCPVPWNEIEGCVAIEIASDIIQSIKPERQDSTSIKGRKAIQTIQEMVKRGLIPMPTWADEEDTHEAQLKGTDLIVTANATIQVKCDFLGGSKSRGGTGNLFLQTQECNPLGLH